MNKIKIFKRSLTLFIVVISLLGLASCKKQNDKIPYGSIGDKTYAQGSGFVVTEKELYNEMRITGLSLLSKEFEKIIFKDEIEEVNNNFENYKEDLIEYANNAIFGTNKPKDLAELKEKDISKAVESYLDSMFLQGVDLNSSDIDGVKFEEHTKKLLDVFVINVAKKNSARKVLNEEVNDKDSSNFVDKDEDINTYFKNNVEKRYPLSFISIRFQNNYEATQTLRNFNIKTFRQNWYIIPDPRKDEVQGYALEVLEELGLESENGKLSEPDHQKYFNKYVVDPGRETEGIKDSLLDENAILYQIIEIYNYIYDYKKIDLTAYEADKSIPIEDILENEEFVKLSEEEKGLFTLEYDDFPINNQSESTLSSLRSYLYNTLSTKEDGTRFTASPRSFGKYYYLLFKLVDHNEDLLEILDEEENLIVWANDEKTVLTEHAQQYFDKLVEEKLTSTYITSKASEKVKEAKITIYDSDLHLFLGNTNYTLAKKFNNDLVAKVNDVEIKVNDFYNLLETQYGASIAMDIAIKKTLAKSKYVDQITKKQHEEFTENMDNMIQQFSNNAFASNGFPASIGRAKFLKLAFQANSKEEAIQKVYVLAEVEKLYLADYESHFEYKEQIYDKFLELANRLQEQTFSLTTGHLIVKVDMDEDENPDSPEEFFQTLSAEEVANYKKEITNLLSLIYTKATKYQNFDSGLEDIVKLYNESARFICEDEYVEDDEDGQNKLCGPEKDWAKYKALGLQIEYQSLGSQTNKTNWPGESNFDEKFYDRIVTFYDYLKEEYYDIDEKFPKQELDSQPVVYEDVLETSFGWHLILALGGDVSKSAKFTRNDDKYIDGDSSKDKIYEKIELKDKDGKVIDTLNAYSDTDQISINQVRIYFHEKGSDYDMNLPSKVVTAVSNYLTPFISSYEQREMRLHLLYKLIEKADFDYVNLSVSNKLDRILEINQKQFLNYADEESHKEYMEIYGDWFQIFN